jgi:antitoxin component of MazEF toxin-antitoxin module
MTVTVKQVGGSVAVVIPKTLAREMDLAAGTPLDISTADGAIVMRKSARGARRPRRPIGEIAARIKPASYRRRNREQVGDGPRGKEIW